MRVFSFRNLRILFLLVILAAVALHSKDQRLVTQGWYRPIDIVIYPINADGSAKTKHYIHSLKSDAFTEVDHFLAKQGQHYQLGVETPTRIHLGPILEEQPPAIPPLNSSRLQILLWSLRLRWWAFQNNELPAGLNGDYAVRAYTLFYDPENNHRLAHSVGIQKGLIAIVNAFADSQYEQQNNIILAHEILHTFGANDKYDPQDSYPLYPQGFAEPDQPAHFPQRYAEIMAVKKATSPTQAEMPNSLRSVLVNRFTAQEIGWLRY